MVNFPPVPNEIRPTAHLLKIAVEHENRNILVTYWARMAACRLALQLVPGQKTPETAELLRVIIGWLEETKKANSDNDGITNQTSAQALIEEYALKLFEHADTLDKQGTFNKNTVKIFYTAGLVMDILDQFENVDEEFKEKRRYAKWKAAYIHNCLKNGEIPIPGPRENVDEDGTVHITDIDEQDLKGYSRFKDPSGSSDTSNEPSEPPKPSSGPDLLNLGGFGNSEVPATSPVTPFLPTNPTPFNTPNPQVSPTVTPQINPTLKPSVPPINNSTGFAPNPEQVQKAQKYCKYAASALNYDDVKNAVDYLAKALGLLQTGTEETS